VPSLDYLQRCLHPVPHMQNEGGNATVAASIVSSSSSAKCGVGLATVLVQHSKSLG
jgi:hypothetical protein